MSKNVNNDVSKDSPILQLSAEVVLSFDFFFFLSLFTTETNAGQSHRLTNCIQNLRRYNLKSLIFKHSLLFIHPFKNTTQVLRPIAHKCYIYISSINLFHLVQNIALSDFRARKNKFENWHFRLIFPLQIKFPTPRAQKIESNARVLPEGGRRCWSFDLIGA